MLVRIWLDTFFLIATLASLRFMEQFFLADLFNCAHQICKLIHFPPAKSHICIGKQLIVLLNSIISSPASPCSLSKLYYCLFSFSSRSSATTSSKFTSSHQNFHHLPFVSSSPVCLVYPLGCLAGTFIKAFHLSTHALSSSPYCLSLLQYNTTDVFVTEA